MEMVGITAVATLMEGKKLKYIVFCVYTGVFLLCLLATLTTSGHVPL